MAGMILNAVLEVAVIDVGHCMVQGVSNRLPLYPGSEAVVGAHILGYFGAGEHPLDVAGLAGAHQEFCTVAVGNDAQESVIEKNPHSLFLLVVNHQLFDICKLQQTLDECKQKLIGFP